MLQLAGWLHLCLPLPLQKAAAAPAALDCSVGCLQKTQLEEVLLVVLLLLLTCLLLLQWLMKAAQQPLQVPPLAQQVSQHP